MKKLSLLLGVLSMVVFMGAMCETDSTTTNATKNENTNTTVESEDINSVSEEETWAEYEINGYTFEYPSNFEIEPIYGERDRFLTEDITYSQARMLKDGEEFALIDCPIVETGYEIWTITSEETRGFEKDGRTYGATLRLLQPNEGSGAGSLGFIFIHRHDYLNWGETTEEFAESCQFLFSEYEDKMDVIEHIYNSIY